MVWEHAIREPRNWLLKGAASLRAARVLRRQIGAANDPYSADLANVMVMLAAIAVENALKAIIVSGAAGVGAPTGAFPTAIKGHDLAKLAATATATDPVKVNVPSDADEKDAIEHGSFYTKTGGRYHSSLTFQEDPERPSLAFDVIDVYERIFLRAVRVVVERTPGRNVQELVEDFEKRVSV